MVTYILLSLLPKHIKIKTNHMKKILTLFFTIFAFTAVSFSQTQAFTVQGGYSWTLGMVGVAYQFDFIEVGAGIMPSTMPGSGDAITSFSAFAALVNYDYNNSGIYTSLGFASQGYRSEMQYNGGSWTDGFTAPMGIVNVGYKLQIYYGLNIKGEIGFGFCEYAKVFTYGITAGWTFSLN